MNQVIRRNKIFLLLFVFFWLLAFVSRVVLEKGDLLTYFGAQRNWSMNQFFSLVTQIAEGHIFVLFAIVFLFIKYKSSIVIASTGVFIMIFANILKQFFKYERPFLYFRNQGLEQAYPKIEGIEPYVGLTSFPSGHTMAGFALMLILSHFFNHKVLQIVFLIMAVLVGISRIYLGHHFLEDVISGSMLGIVIAILAIHFIEKINSPVLEKSLKINWTNKA